MYIGQNKHLFRGYFTVIVRYIYNLQITITYAKVIKVTHSKWHIQYVAFDCIFINVLS